MMAITAVLVIAVFVDMARSVIHRPRLPDADMGGVVYRGGGDWSLARERKKGPMLLSFFATWCGPCRLEYPHLVELQAKLAGKGAQVVLLTREDSTDIDVDKLFSKSPIPIVTHADQLFDAFNVNGIPRTIVVNAKGEIELDVEGYDAGVVGRAEAILLK